MLNAPLTLEEVSLEATKMANSKSLGADVLLTKTYKKYGETLLPVFLKTLNDARQGSLKTYFIA